MQLLGIYQSNLSEWYYNELISLVNTAISQGDYAGGFTFSQANIANIVANGVAFNKLTLPSAGSRSLDEDINNPLTLLQARFNSIAQEISDFTAKISILIDILNKDTVLLDQLLAAARLNVWSNSLPSISGSTQFCWDFGIGFGNVGFALSPIDPTNSVVYSNPSKIQNYFDLQANVETIGLTPNSNVNIFSPKDLKWSYDSVGFDAISYGTDWTDLDFLENQVLLTFKNPQLEVILPNSNLVSPFSISGVSTTKGIPIFIRTSFTGRFTSINVTSKSNVVASNSQVRILPGDQISISAGIVAETGTDGSCSLYVRYRDVNSNLVVNQAGTTVLTLVGSLTSSGNVNNSITIPNLANIYTCELILISNSVSTGSYTLAANVNISVPIRLTNGYDIDPTKVAVFSGSTYYILNKDYLATGNGNITLINIPSDLDLTISFLEYFPSYQCSVNRTVWSQTIMFDSNRPYPDNDSQYLPIPMGLDSKGVRNKLPIIDELGIGSGLYISLDNILDGDYLLKVYQDADSNNAGKQAQLTIDFGQPRFMNILNLSSYTNFPVNIKNIDVQGFSTNTTQSVFVGNFILQKPTVFRFQSTLVSKVIITFSQENYSIKQHQVVPDDYLRRKAINDLQAIIPTLAQESNILPKVIFASGFQYEFGIESISGGFESVNLPTVFNAGPFKVNYKPSTITLNADFEGSISFYLCYVVYNENEEVINEDLVGTQITNNHTIPFPVHITTAVDHTELYLKIVFRTANASLKAYSLQVD